VCLCEVVKDIILFLEIFHINSYSRLNGGLLQSLVENMNAKAEGLPDNLTYNLLEGHMIGLVISWLVKIFDDCITHMWSTNVCIV
jgi:hypothetical protein